MAKISITLADSAEEIGRKLLEVFRDRLNRAFKLAAAPIRRRIRNTCESLITNTNEYRSLLHGTLLGELGIPDVDPRVRSILNTIKKNIDVRPGLVRISGDQLVGGMKIGILRAGFEDILNLPASSYVSNGHYDIPWLRWLIIEGDRIIVYTHEIVFDLNTAERARSRTGLALMKPGSGWRVPPEFSGTEESNFLTRAFDGPAVAQLLADIIREEIQARV